MNIVDLNEEQVDEIETRLETYDENYITYKMNGSIQIGMEDDGKLIAGLRWFFFDNVMALDDSKK